MDWTAPISSGESGEVASVEITDDTKSLALSYMQALGGIALEGNLIAMLMAELANKVKEREAAVDRVLKEAYSFPHDDKVALSTVAQDLDIEARFDDIIRMAADIRTRIGRSSLALNTGERGAGFELDAAVAYSRSCARRDRTSLCVKS